jgi:hypothetical protein
MNIVITSESVWQLFLGLGGMGLVWMVLKWVGIRLGRWWNADSVKSQIEKVRQELQRRHGRSVEVSVTTNPHQVALYWRKRDNSGQQTDCGHFDKYQFKGVKNAAKTKLKIMKDYLHTLDVEAL